MPHAALVQLPLQAGTCVKPLGFSYYSSLQGPSDHTDCVTATAACQPQHVHELAFRDRSS